MIPRDHIRSLAHKLLEAKSEEERLRAVEEESRKLLLEFKREAVERALSLVVLTGSRGIEGVLGPRWQRRGKRITPWNCRACGSRWASQVRRNGHYKRNLVVGEGLITLRVPQVECKGRGRSISIAGGLLRPRSRYWIELDKEVTELYLSGVFHRKVVEMLARRIQSSLSPMTSWRALQRVGERAGKRKEAPPHPLPFPSLGIPVRRDPVRKDRCSRKILIA